MFSWRASDSFSLVLSATVPGSVVSHNQYNALVFQSASIVKWYMIGMKWLWHCLRRSQTGGTWNDKGVRGRTAEHLIWPRALSFTGSLFPESRLDFYVECWAVIVNTTCFLVQASGFWSGILEVTPCSGVRKYPKVQVRVCDNRSWGIISKMCVYVYILCSCEYRPMYHSQSESVSIWIIWLADIVSTPTVQSVLVRF